jgi:hypothetical protein
MAAKSHLRLRDCLGTGVAPSRTKACCGRRSRRLRFEVLEDRQLLTAGGLVAALGGEGEGDGAGGDVRLFVPDDLVVARGGLITVPVKFEITKTAGTGISSFDVVIEFEPTILTVGGSELGPLLAGSNSDLDLTMTNRVDGILIFSGDSVHGSVPFDAGSVGDLFTVTFAVAGDAVSGPVPINIRAAYGQTATAVFANDLNELVLWPAPTDGSGDSIDGVVTIVEVPRIDLTIVRQPTETGGDGEVASLPASADWVHEWESFWVELWVSTSEATPAAIAAATVDLQYNTEYLTAQEIIHGSAFGLDLTGTIDDALGQVGGIGGRTELIDVGDGEYVLLARVRFVSSGDGVPVHPLGRSIGPYDMQMAMAHGQTVLVGGGSSMSEVGESPGTELWAVVYDIDNNHRIDFGDLAFFSPAFGKKVEESGSEPPYVWWADFDKSGWVDYGDLSFFAPNFGKSRSAVQAGHAALMFPPNFPDAWRVQSPSGAEGESWAWVGQVGWEPPSAVDRRVAGLDSPKLSRGSQREAAPPIGESHAVASTLLRSNAREALERLGGGGRECTVVEKLEDTLSLLADPRLASRVAFFRSVPL